MEKSPIEKYADIQPLVLKDIGDATARMQKDRQYEVVKVPAHTHNGSDSKPVEFSDLGSVQYHSLLRTTVLSPAQVKALFTAPVQLVAPLATARGVIIVDGITCRLAYTGTAYAGANNIEFRYTDASGAKVAADATAAFLNSVASAFYQSNPASGYVAVSGGSGTAGRIVACVPTADPTTGNSQLFVTVKYHIAAFPA